MKAGEHKQLTGKQYGDLTVVQYAPENCRWATKLQQTENRRKKYVVTQK